MNQFEPLHTPAKIASMFGVSTAYVRAACYRGKDYHPLPAIDVGTKSRRVFRIRPSVFERWVAEEEVR